MVQDTFQGLRGLFWRRQWNGVAIGNLGISLILLATTIAQGRELAIWENANAPLQRAMWSNTQNQASMIIRTPIWMLCWEFLSTILAGIWLAKGA
ncbi:hypothetical protein F5Y11DRAFT_309252 [Daldinia sp. FL1419]|nr:hypothetical protein F5Y11DRAFT_309252 [Daldinia sp. FL1419]